jgi:hypothetical protein
MAVLEKRPDVILDNVGKMIVFLDEKQDIYVYKPKKYHIENIIKKLGKNSYYDLRGKGLNSCDDGHSASCSEIHIEENSIRFHRDDGEVIISTEGKRFLLLKKSGKIRIKTIENYHGGTRPKKCRNRPKNPSVVGYSYGHK